MFYVLNYVDNTCRYATGLMNTTGPDILIR